MKSTLEVLYDLYEQKMYRLAYSVVQNVQQAEDITHDCFVKMADHVEGINDVYSARTKSWILKIVKNEAIDCYRKNQRNSKMLEAVHGKYRISEYDNVDKRMQNLMDEEYVQVILEQVPNSYREVLQLKYFDELSTGEIASKLGISESGVGKRLIRAKKYILELTGGKENESYKKAE